MNNRNYNPLNEGYTGKTSKQKGDTEDSRSSSQAPAILPKIQSAVVKPSQLFSSNKSQSNNGQ